jgi:hypothetical protein
MKYMLLYAFDEEREWSETQASDARTVFDTWFDEATRRKVHLQGGRLRPTSDATTVRVRGGEVLLTDGPFAETKEQFVGYDVLECADDEEALAWATRHPHAHMGAAEVRPFFDDPGSATLPEQQPMTKRYLLLICVEKSPQLSPEEAARIGPATERWVIENDSKGIRLFGNQLAPVDAARTVRVEEGRTFVVDGPFAETKEQIAGFDVLECADLDEALTVAAAHPVATFGAVEVRPLWPFDEA